MDILFINSNQTLILKKEVNGTLLLATKLLQAGFDTDILRFGQVSHEGEDYMTFIGNMVQAILAREPKCVSFYSLWPDYHIMLRIARELKAVKEDLIIIFGGPQSSGTAQRTMEAMPFVDYISTGEGEDIVVPLFQAMLRGEGSVENIPGLYYRKAGEVCRNTKVQPLCDLNTLPRWDERLLLLDSPDPDIHSRSYFMPIDAGRGCPYSCSFCCTSYFWRRTYRLKTPERIVADIRYFHDRFGIRSFWFSHDAFTINRELVTKVCDKILEEGLDITWRCSARVDCLTEELILKMKSAGMIQIEMGIETGSPRMQKLINKNLDLEKAQKMIRFIVKNDIRVAAFFMYGFPEETEEDLNQTLELAFNLVDMGVGSANMAFTKFCPETAITEKYLDELEFDSSIKIDYRSTFGYEEEVETFRANKALFPFFHHLKTPLRDQYQYLHFLGKVYQEFPRIIRYLRDLYKGDNLRFYRDFLNANREIIEGDVAEAKKYVQERPLELLLNTTRTLDFPTIRQLEGLLQYAWDCSQVAKKKGDNSIRGTYSFNYADLKLRHPIEAYSPGTSDILIEKVDGKMQIKVISIHWGE